MTHPAGFSRIALCLCATVVASAAEAQTTAPRPAPRRAPSPLAELQRQVAEQGREIEALRQSMAEQTARHEELQRALAENRAAADAAATAAARSEPRAVAVAPRPIQVGQPPSQDTRTFNVAPLFEQPGILTPKGTIVLEPSVQYAYSSSNQVALVGYTIIPSLLIGLVDVRQVKQHTFTTALTGRFGITNRFEIEAKLPYVYRSNSTVSREIFTGSAIDNVFETSGRHIGDAEVTARYQFNEGDASTPYMIGTLRFKSRTGKDPFEVVTDCVTRCIGNTTGTGLPLDLPTGSGFYTLQPGLTWLFPSDPVVFFGSFSYAYNFKRSGVSRTVRDGGTEFLGDFRAGDVIGMNFGMGLALNDKSSFSIGVDLNSVGRVKQNGTPVPGSVRTQLATLMLGYSYRYDAKRSVNISVGAGLTRDTPDLTLTARIPFTF
ncbi:acetate kinase [Variovorax sp. N23]|uniref:acetate kinase n=1 Tax=Variovorax sp. N23 TaxID=2980555 RepID=UPI0021C8B5F0|nr:acetate kinase [Variovorax sp. N23]MCU4119424.1 acetate kinase [Variovorax sp. N23]